MVVADVTVEVVLVDHLVHVREDLVGGGDRRADPRFEPVAERVQVAVGADTGVLVGEPRAPEALELLEDDERLLRVLLLQVVPGADAGKGGVMRIDMNVSLSPEQVAQAFWNLPADDMVKFFAELDRVAGIMLCFQMAGVVQEMARNETDDHHRAMNGFRTMLAHSMEYANDATD